jgi:phosphatidylinositol glycan class S
MTHSLLALCPSTLPEIPLRAIKYQPNVTLSFVLLNEDSAEGGYVRSWDIREAIAGESCSLCQRRKFTDMAEHIKPHLDPLKDIFNFTIESQVLYHAPLTFEPTRGRSAGFSRDSGNQKQLDHALDQASHGEPRAEEVAKALLEEEKGEDGWEVDEEMMKVFVNTESWSLGKLETPHRCAIQC